MKQEQSVSQSGLEIDRMDYKDEALIIFDVPKLTVKSAELIDGDVLIVAGDTQYESEIDAPDNATIESNSGMVIVTIPK